MGNCTGGGDVEVSGEGFWLLGLGLLFCFLSVLSRGRDCLDPVSSLLFTFGTDCWARLPPTSARPEAESVVSFPYTRRLGLPGPHRHNHRGPRPFAHLRSSR